MANGKPLLKEKDKKEKTLTLGKWQIKCDKRLQEIGRQRFKKCEACSKPMYCLHHFITKGLSARLRYDWDNLVPICPSCHFAHHKKSDPNIHATVIKKRGQAWYDLLESKRREHMDVNVGYYKYVWEMLK